MNESERVALAWVRNYIKGHHCPRCDSEWLTVASIGVLAHHCDSLRGIRQRRKITLPPVAATREELLAEAREQEVIFHSLEDALGDTALRGENE